MGFSSPQAAGLQPKRFGMPWLEPKVASRCGSAWLTENNLVGTWHLTN